MNNQSILYQNFLEIISTANFFKQFTQAHLTIKKYAFMTVQHSIQSQNGQLYQNEKLDFDNQYQNFNSEVMSIGGPNYAFLIKENYDKFVYQNFSNVNFDICDINTLLLANNLIKTMNIYGELSEKYASHQRFVISRISQLKMSQMPQNMNLMGNIQNNNNTNIDQNNTNTNKINNKHQVNQGGNNNNKIVNIESKNIQLPVVKGSEDYNLLRKEIKKQLMLAEQEALYNKLDFSKKHIEIALYYLNNIRE